MFVDKLFQHNHKSKPEQSGYRQQFQMHVLERKFLHFNSNFSNICSKNSDWQKVNIGSGNGLALKRWQAITQTHWWQPFSSGLIVFTHWDRVTHICVSNQTIIGSNNGLSPGQPQAIIWTNAGIFLTGTSGTYFSEILIELCIILLKKMHLKMSSEQ